MHDLFSGSALVDVSSDGACTLPRLISEVVERRSGARTVLLGAHEADPCLSGYDRSFAAQLYGRAAERNAEQAGAWLRRLFGTAEEVPFTLRRRLVIPPFLLRRSGIARQALFIGTGGSFEIWDPEAARSGTDRALAEIASWHLQTHHLQLA